MEHNLCRALVFNQSKMKQSHSINKHDFYFQNSDCCHPKVPTLLVHTFCTSRKAWLSVMHALELTLKQSTTLPRYICKNEPADGVTRTQNKCKIRKCTSQIEAPSPLSLPPRATPSLGRKAVQIPHPHENYQITVLTSY